MPPSNGPAVVVGPPVPGTDRVLTPDALTLLSRLHRRFDTRRHDLLAVRAARQGEANATGTIAVPEAVRAIAADPDWRVAPAPADLADRRCEITGPTDAKMAINALRSGAKVWLADLEDANTPHWHNVVGGQVVLQDAVRRTLRHEVDDGTVYTLPQEDDLATIVTRPRGWHLDERHLTVDGAPVSGSIVDAALYVLHNAEELLARGSGPYLYLAKLESAAEAALWRDVLTAIEEHLGLPTGTVRVTVLIETITAAFELEAILHELRPHVTGLNAGRWDYLFSIIKVFRSAGPDFVLPDRSDVPMTVPFMRAYSELLVSACHRRGAHAIGGMSAFIPSRRDPEVTARALAKVRADKEREADDGFDGSWVAHPDLVPLCTEVFSDRLGDRPNQLDRPHGEVSTDPDALLDLRSTGGAITRAGVRTNVAVGVEYLAAWLGGRGAVAIDNLMEDAATAEISRAQLWQWREAGATCDDGTPIDDALVGGMLTEEMSRLVDLSPDEETAARVRTAAELFTRVALGSDFVDFLTLPAYDLLAPPEARDAVDRDASTR
ncbi:malate synthase A [Nitriliruptor alkaliphilus]|uniref:malate synthase A n=1 Tax=Nitriliruptor alkaliphilus TaxID=427918 RepID=UPI0006973876|nr:malate synthase A [Nitriliruptor alkaliphilus]